MFKIEENCNGLQNPTNTSNTLQSQYSKNIVAAILDSSLPIAERKEEIEKMFINNDTSILIGETGSGKTTISPLILLNALPENTKITITQPRRLAAISVSKFVAKSTGSQIGEKIGYQIRFEDAISSETQANFMTDGILLRYLQQDLLLMNFDVVMIDEAHERSLNIDILLGLLKRAQKHRKEKGLKPLKLIVASATIEKEKFLNYFNNSGSLQVSGRMYKVNIHHSQENLFELKDKINHAYKIISEEILPKNQKGDILIFMPGESEIKATISRLKELGLNEVEFIPLYGNMSPDEQEQIFKSSNKRKVIVSTNIAETSITVPGVKYVIDSGLIKQKSYNPETRIESLNTVEHSQSGCTQRTGRAGRTEEGDCFRLFTQRSFDFRQEFSVPEIKRLNLEHTILQMKKMGIEDIENFDFIDNPGESAIKESLKNLQMLGALDLDYNITELGCKMSEFPLEPTISRMILESEKFDCTGDICIISAFLGNKNIFIRPKDPEQQMAADKAQLVFKNKSSDFLTLLNIWSEYEKNGKSSSWARQNYLNSKVLEEIDEIKNQLFRIVSSMGIDVSHTNNDENIEKVVTYSFIYNLFRMNGKNEFKRLSDDVCKDYYIHPSSAIFNLYNPLFVATNTIVTTRLFTRNCQKVKPEWLKELCPELFEEKERFNMNRDGELHKIVTPIFQATGETLPEYSVKATGKEISDYMFKQDIEHILHKAEYVNKNIILQIKKYNLVTDGKYTKALEKIKDKIKTDLENIQKIYGDCCDQNGALNENELMSQITININDYIDSEEINQLDNLYPDRITINDKIFEVKYHIEYIYILINSIQELLIIDTLPLINGKKIYLRLQVTDSNALISNDEELKKYQKELKESKISKITNEDIQKVIDAAKDNYTAKRILEIFNRSGGKFGIDFERIKQEVINKFYNKILKDEYYSRYTYYQVDLRMTDYISQSEYITICENYPEYISIKGTDYHVTYNYNQENNEYFAYIKVEKEGILNIGFIPRLPATPLQIYYYPDAGKKIIITNNDELDNSKAPALKSKKSEEWEMYKKSNNTQTGTSNSNIVNDIPEFPDIIIFASSYKAYPMLKIKMLKGGNYEYYFEYEIDENIVLKNNQESIAIIKKERGIYLSEQDKIKYTKLAENKISEIKNFLAILREEGESEEELKRILNGVEAIMQYMKESPQEALEDLNQLL